jgi:superfamily II DNA or RNA helicase
MSVTDKHCVQPVTGRKGPSMTTLRKWQRAALQKVVESRSEGRGHALIAACPGAGKTRLTVEVWKTYASHDCEVMVVVVPSRALKRQWKTAFKSFGVGALDAVKNKILEAHAYHDEEMFDANRPIQVYTYAQIASNPDLFRILCSRHRVFVVFDEIHHADDDEKFGEALVYAFEAADFRLSLSGTPFNTRGGRLAFCEVEKITDDDGRDINRTKTDYAYSYGDALSVAGTPEDPEVVRPVQFVRWNGLATWQRMYPSKGITVEKTVTGAKKSDPLWPLLDMVNGQYLPRMIDAAIQRLMEIREHQSNAGMLITAMDRDHCEQIAMYLRSKGIHDSRTIVYDTPGAADAIIDFGRSKDRVLIAVKMISEGVDIKRLRVGVYASNILTQMFFIQFIGRFIRWDGSLPASQFACVFIPEHVTLMKYAIEIERMVAEAEERSGGDEPGDPKEPKQDGFNLGLQSVCESNGIIERRDRIEREEAESLRNAIRDAGYSGQVTEGMLKRLLDHLKIGGVPVKDTLHQEMPETDLSKQNDKLVGRIVRISEALGKPLRFQDINAAANKHVGIRAKDSLTPDHVLQKRSEFLKQWIVRLRETGDAA